MTMSCLNQNGEIKIPLEILGELHLRTGDMVELCMEKDGSLKLFPKRRSVADVRGMLAGKTHVRATIEEMDSAIAHGFRTGKL